MNRQKLNRLYRTKKVPISQPLVSHIYTDPSAHIFNDKIYCPSHIRYERPENDNGDHFNMMDYHVLSMIQLVAVTDHGAIDIKSIPGRRQLWAPDARLRTILTSVFSCER
jgi:hypothetical protein